MCGDAAIDSVGLDEWTQREKPDVSVKFLVEWSMLVDREVRHQAGSPSGVGSYINNNERS
jgi:hypothetical protein